MAHRSDEILCRLPPGPVVGAEIGVFAGATSARLLKREDLTLYMIDTWAPFMADNILIASASEQADNLKTAIEATDFADKRRHVLRLLSMDAAQQIEDGSLDFVFIDGDHSYSAVSADIRTWLPKIKSGGSLCGHDYANRDYLFGDEVKRAVDDAAAANGWHVDLGGDFTWFVRV